MSIAKLNVVVVLIDALRARNLACYGYHKRTSPNIDRIAAEGVTFEKAYSTINTTDPSLTTIFTGLFPLRHGIVNHGSRVTQKEIENLYRSGIRTLPEILKSHGYTTCAVDWLGRWHKKGYDHYSEEPSSRPSTMQKLLRAVSPYYYRLPQTAKKIVRKVYNPFRAKVPDAKTYTDEAIDFLNDANGPFFLFVHYWGAHSPYQAPKDLSTRFRDPEESTVEPNTIIDSIQNAEYKDFYANHLLYGVRDAADVIARYDGAICFIDQQIGRLVQTLQAKGLFEKTLIIITSDHGESLIEHGIYFDHHGLYQEILHVPLIMCCPAALPKASSISAVIQHVDLLPTILDLTGCGSDLDVCDGQSLRPLIDGTPYKTRSYIYAEEFNRERRATMSDGRFKLIFTPSGEVSVCEVCGRTHGDALELYDLANDPFETTNLVSRWPDISTSLQREYHRLSADLKSIGKAKERQKIRQRIQRLKVADLAAGRPDTAA